MTEGHTDPPFLIAQYPKTWNYPWLCNKSLYQSRVISLNSWVQSSLATSLSLDLTVHVLKSVSMRDIKILSGICSNLWNSLHSKHFPFARHQHKLFCICRFFGNYCFPPMCFLFVFGCLKWLPLCVYIITQKMPDCNTENCTKYIKTSCWYR